ncbi:hypothetical protein BKA70DRAFT_1428881 [Coprinopsis sp. MPI-PUGE-AT-0042]|nr:hypothetical protein BKA70DRAFT_1428881 [Coprinopsis sp. MPI-PUGE-AT-0042]
MQKLQTLRINCGGIGFFRHEPIEPSQFQATSLPHLRTLELQDQFMTFLDLNIIAAFDTPKLERFDYLCSLGDADGSLLMYKDMDPILSVLKSSTHLMTVNIVYAQDLWLLDPVTSFPEDGYWVAEIPAVDFRRLANQCSQWPPYEPNDCSLNFSSRKQLLFTTCGAQFRRTIHLGQRPKEGYVEDLVGWIKETTGLLPANTYAECNYELGNFETLVAKLQPLQAAVDQGSWSFFMQLNLL